MGAQLYGIYGAKEFKRSFKVYEEESISGVDPVPQSMLIFSFSRSPDS